MTAAALREHWLHAIRIADAAVQAATRVDTLSADEASRHRQALASDRAWLSAFQWSTVR